MQHNTIRIKVLLDAQAVAAAAGAGGIIEGEQSRFQFIDAVATLGQAKRAEKLISSRHSSM